MTTFQQQFSSRVRHGVMGLIVGGLALVAPRAGAAPYTSNFDDLIADLQTRAAALSNSTEKVEEKAFKTIEKVLGTLNKSSSLTTDIKNLGSVANTLIKAFPTDYTPPGSSLLTNTETALDGLIDNVQTMINTTETNASDLTASCATKAQASVNTAQTDLDAASAADIPTAAKLLGTALKAELKAETAVAKCALKGTGNGGGGGSTNTNDFVTATITGDFDNSFATSLLPPAATVADLGFLISISAGEPAFGGTAMSLEVMNVTGTNTYPIQIDSDLHRTNPSNTFFVVEGELTFTTYDLTNRLLAGTFNYTATDTNDNETITVTNGVFHFTNVQFVGGTP